MYGLCAEDGASFTSSWTPVGTNRVQKGMRDSASEHGSKARCGLQKHSIRTHDDRWRFTAVRAITGAECLLSKCRILSEDPSERFRESARGLRLALWCALSRRPPPGTWAPLCTFERRGCGVWGRLRETPRRLDLSISVHSGVLALASAGAVLCLRIGATLVASDVEWCVCAQHCAVLV